MPLEAQNLHFRYGPNAPYVLQGVALRVEAGERVGVIAPSGAGKTTLMKLLAGHGRPTSGKVLLDGAPLLPAGSRNRPLPVQLISQHPEQAINPRWRMGRVLAEADQLQPEVLTPLGIEEDWLNRYPRELSGGELQRFCIARALGPATRYLLADELSTMLDGVTQAQLWHYLLAEAQRRHLGMVVVTHNPALAEKVCTRVVDLSHIHANSNGK